MTETRLTTMQLMDKAYEILLKELGPVDFVRVVQQFTGGSGDYTRERHLWLDRVTLEQFREIAKSLPRE